MEEKVIEIKIKGMDCYDESEVIGKKMRSLTSVKNFDINIMTQQIKINYDPSLISIQDIIKTIAETGMKASIVKGKREKEKIWWVQNTQMLSLMVCGILTGIAILLENSSISSHFGVPHQSFNLIYGLAILVGIYYPSKMGFLALKTLTFNIRLLMTVGAIGAILLGFWEEAALLVFIYSLGDVLEAYAVDKTRGAIRSLMELVPKEAIVKREGVEIILPTEEIEPSDTIIV